MTTEPSSTNLAPSSTVRRWLPGVDVAFTYRRPWLGRDLVAGLVLSAILIPQGMAYAELAGLPAITGLYTSIACMLAYALFGPSRVLVLGPDSALGPMIAATITPLVLASMFPGVEASHRVALASELALLTGIIMVVIGVAKLGFIADLLSRPTQIGYLNGLALTIMVSQLPKLLGFTASADGIFAQLAATWHAIVAGRINTTAALVGVGTLIVILLVQRLWRAVPAVLVGVLAATLVVALADLAQSGVRTVGVLPHGLPSVSLALPSWSNFAELALGALAISVVSLADAMTTTTTFAVRRHEQPRSNQESIAIGAANIAASLFHGFPISTSAARTAVAERAGARTQLTSVIGAIVIVLLLAFGNTLLRDVPQPALAAVVIVAAISLVDIASMRQFWHERRSEFYLALAALIGVAVFGVLGGIGIAVVLSILNVFRHAWWPHQTELGRVPDMTGLHDVETYPQAERLPGFFVYRFDAPLMFANSRNFGMTVRQLAEARPEIEWFVLASEPITDVDTTAAAMLRELADWLEARHSTLVFAEMKDRVRDKVQHYGLVARVGPERFFPTIDDAIAAYQAESGRDWRALE